MKVVRCLVDLYWFELFLGFAICCSRVCHTSGRNIEAFNIMKVVMLIMVLEVLMMKSRVYDKTLAKVVVRVYGVKV